MKPYAEDVGNYWKTSNISADGWIERAKKEIVGAGGTVQASAIVTNEETSSTIIMIRFAIADDVYSIRWAALESRTGNHKAAITQAATALYHSIKAKAVEAKFLGERAAFAQFLLLPSGKTVMETSTPELEAQIQSARRLLVSG